MITVQYNAGYLSLHENRIETTTGLREFIRSDVVKPQNECENVCRKRKQQFHNSVVILFIFNKTHI